MRLQWLVPWVAAAVLWSSTALAEVPRERSVIIGGDFSVSYQHIDSSEGSGAISLFRVAPSFDYVVSRGLTVGAWLVFEHISAGDEDANEYGIIPRIGYAAELGDRAFIWPRFGIGYIHGLPDLFNIPLGSNEPNRVQLDVDLMFLFVPAGHFFIGGGPLFRTDLRSTVDGEDAGKLTTFGVTTMVGGWF